VKTRLRRALGVPTLGPEKKSKKERFFTTQCMDKGKNHTVMVNWTDKKRDKRNSLAQRSSYKRREPWEGTVYDHT